MTSADLIKWIDLIGLFQYEEQGFPLVESHIAARREKKTRRFKIQMSKAKQCP